MNTKQILRYFTTVLLTLSFEIFAIHRRRRIWSSSGSNNDYEQTAGSSQKTVAIIIFIGIGLVIALSLGYFIYNFLLSSKSRAAKAVIDQSEKEDSIWKHEQLIKKVEDSFLEIQKAWTARDMKNVEHRVSPLLYDRYQLIFERMKHNKIQFVTDQFSITKIEIIKARDLKDDTKDSFSASISRSIVDYKTNGNTNTILEWNSNKRRKFKDIYHFTRKGQHWILDRIENEITFWDIIFVGSSKKEK